MQDLSPAFSDCKRVLSLDEVFLEVGKFFRVRAADDGEKIEPSKFFKSTRASDEQFLKHWEQVASPTRERKIAKYLLLFLRAQLEASIIGRK